MSLRPRFAFVVNDDPVQLGVLSSLLRKAGLEPRAFPSAEAALAAMSTGVGVAADPHGDLPALVVTDLYMPGIDGWRFCRLLRSPEYAACNAIPLLVVSATFAGDSASRIADDLGAEGFLPSPVDGPRFVEQVRAILQGELMRNPPRVLIVDDNDALGGLLAEVFILHGYQPAVALSVQTATEAFARTAFDVAVIDYHLLDGMGDTLLERFREQRPDCVCLMMTSDSGPELALNWMKRGAAAFLHKPFQPDYLIELCARARRERALLRVQDLLDRRTGELRESEERFRSYVDCAPLGIFLHDETGRFLQVNPATTAMTGYTSEELLQLRVSDLLPPASQALAAQHLQAMATTGRGSAEFAFSPKGGRAGQWSLEGVRLSPNRFMGLVTDITERERVKTENAKLEAQFQQAQKLESVGRLAGGVAHDFNNMLQAILGNVDYALKEVPAGTSLFESLEEIRKCAQRSADLTWQLLAFARKQTIAPRVLELNLAVAGILRMLHRLIGEDLNLIWLPAADLWPVKMDSTQVDQLLANLCVNSRDAIDGVGNITIETRNAALSEADCAGRPGRQAGDYVLLAVKDDGCGMTKETLAHVFEPFFTTKRQGEGTGLGLATVYGIVQQNGGFIEVSSAPGEGTIFSIYLPRHASPAAEPRRHYPAPPVRSSGETVFLVDDEPAILIITRKILLKLGYTVLTAPTPEDALRLAEAHEDEIHLLISDVVMPGMNGRVLADRMASLYPGLKRLFMSGYTANVIAPTGVLEDDTHFIQKPFSADVLAAKVRYVLDAN